MKEKQTRKNTMTFKCLGVALTVLLLSLAVSSLGSYVFPSKTLFGLVIFLSITGFLAKGRKAILTGALLFVSTVLIAEFMYRVENKISYGYSYYVEQSIHYVTQTKSIITAMPLIIVAAGLLVYLCKMYFSDDEVSVYD